MTAHNGIKTFEQSGFYERYLTNDTLLLRQRISDRAEYIRTPDAVAFMDAVSRAGLELSDSTKNELAQEGDSRYGNAYAWLSRSVASWVSTGREENSDISILKRPEPTWSDEDNDYVYSGTTDLTRLEPAGSPGADLLIYLMRQAADAQKYGDHSSEIPVTKDIRGMKRDGCKDVEVYFAQAVSGFAGPEAIKTVQIGDKQFWHKTHGARTFINLEQVIYNGVKLPPGCVFRKENDGYLFLRITGLAFDQKTAEKLFGSAISSWHEMKDGSEDLKNLFDAFQHDRDLVAKSKTAFGY